MLNLNLASRGSPAPTHVQQMTSAFCGREGGREGGGKEKEGGRRKRGGEEEEDENECKLSDPHILPPSHCPPNLQ